MDAALFEGNSLVNSNDKFGRFRNLVWPIHNNELKKFMPLFVMFFLISFDYNVLRTMKDTLVITAKGSGAEVIPFIKVWAMFPGAILMTFLFTWLSNRFSRESVFYTLMGIFLSYIFVFVIFLYPNHHALHNHAFGQFLESVLPLGCKGLISMVKNWTFTLFYVMSELWGNIILIVLFWGFVNQVTNINEAKRFYGLFGLGANISGIVSGQVSVYLSKKAFDANLPFGTNSWEQSLILLLALVLIAGIAAIFLYRWINKHVLSDPKFYCDRTRAQEKAIKGKLSMKDSFSVLFKSKYLIYIAIVVVGYNVVINLVEVLWKDQLRELYPNPSDYNMYINQISTIIGIVSTLSAIFISSNAIRRFGWTFTALITPAILLITSIGFFGILLFKGYLETTQSLIFGLTPVAAIVFMGSLQNILSRGAKYTVFDATKEMAFIPLDSETKVKGKAAIDGVFNRLGKSGGSVIHQGLLIVFASFAVTAPYIAGILVLVIGGWMAAVKALGREFNVKIGEAPQIPVETPVKEDSKPKVIMKPSFSR